MQKKSSVAPSGQGMALPHIHFSSSPLEETLETGLQRAISENCTSDYGLRTPAYRLDSAAGRDDSADPDLRVFTWMWALAALYHGAATVFWVRDPVALSYFAFIVAALVRPNLNTLLGLLVSQWIDVLIRIPFATNHYVFSLFVDTTILLAWMREIVRRRGARPTETQLYESFTPFLRIEVLILYSMAAFHKLNWDFLSPASSCAVELIRVEIPRFFHFLPRVPPSALLDYMLIAGAVLCEASLAVMLFVSRWRLAGIVVGLVFHWVLGMTDHVDFCVTMAATYVVFLPGGFLPAAALWLESTLGAFARRARSAFGFLPIAAGLALLTSAWLYGRGFFSITRMFLLTWLPIGVSAAIGFTWVAFQVRRRISWSTSSGLRPPYRFGLIVPALVLANGVSPYLGFKTESSFAMYSNLRTEANMGNHLLVPASWKIWRFQDDLVQVKSTSDADLWDISGQGTMLVPFFVVQDRLWRRGQDMQIRYLRNGIDYDLKSAREDPELIAPHPLWIHKIVRMRAVDPGPRQRCLH
jgi:hypothetical protein